MTFVDFREEFDSIHSGKLSEILKAYGVPKEIVDAVNTMCTNTIAQVSSADGDTEFIEILAGVLQGDTLAPYLFITALDYATGQAIGTKATWDSLSKGREAGDTRPIQLVTLSLQTI